MGPELLILNRISRHIAQAVLPIPRIGRKGHKSSCFVGISTTLPSPWDQSLFLMCRCMQTLPLWLHLLERGDTEETGLGLGQLGEVQRAGTCPGRCSHQTGPPGVCSEESSWSSGHIRNLYSYGNIRDPGQPFLWSVCGSVITCSWPRYLSLNFAGRGTWMLLLKTWDSITPNSAGLHEQMKHKKQLFERSKVIFCFMFISCAHFISCTTFAPMAAVFGRNLQINWYFTAKSRNGLNSWKRETPSSCIYFYGNKI